MKNKLPILTLIFTFSFSLSFGMKPEKKYIYTPKGYGFAFKEMKVKTTDNFMINTWNILPKLKGKKNITVVLLSGDSGNMSYLLSQALHLADKGYNVITFDYRGFGHSQDFKVDTTNLLFHNEFLLDFEAVVRHAKKLYPKNKIGSFGFSMGGYFPVITKMKLDFIMADSPLISPKIFVLRLEMPDTTLPDNYVEPTEKKVPQLYFIGSKDKRILIEDIPDNCAVLYKGDHLRGETVLKDRYYELIDSFLTNLK
ncbi:MAG: hypothetical protein RLZZ306_3649 [Bacteroidota bacterium]|jgi:hypothetical protein